MEYTQWAGGTPSWEDCVGVLILILMEYTQWGNSRLTTEVAHCLNPYSNGICSMIVKYKYPLFIVIYKIWRQKLFTNHFKKDSFLRACKGTIFLQHVKERFC